jgi:hypothetical protein
LVFAVLFKRACSSSEGTPLRSLRIVARRSIGKVLQRPYGPPTKTTAPVAFPGGASGTQCEYRTVKVPAGKVVFIIYVDASPAVAKDTFNKLSAFYAPNTPLPGVGDVAIVIPAMPFTS